MLKVKCSRKKKRILSKFLGKLSLVTHLTCHSCAFMTNDFNNQDIVTYPRWRKAEWWWSLSLAWSSLPLTITSLMSLWWSQVRLSVAISTRWASDNITLRERGSLAPGPGPGYGGLNLRYREQQRSHVQTLAAIHDNMELMWTQGHITLTF